MNSNFKEFLCITRELNKHHITPLLMGSVGLEYQSKKDWQSDDIDIHVPGDKHGFKVDAEEVIYQWQEIKQIMTRLGYSLTDLYEHKFTKTGYSVGFGVMNTLPDFASIDLKNLESHKLDEVDFLLPSLADFLAIYQASSQDSYRAQKNNQKDFPKMDYLKMILP